jgi:hypothetical protein
MVETRRRGYNTFTRSASPIGARSAPVSLRSSPVAPTLGAVGILPARRGKIELLIAGVAVFAPAAVAALMFTALGVLLLGSSTAVVDEQIVFVWPPSSAAGFISAVVLAVCLPLWLAYSLHMMRAYAHSQVDRGGGMSVAGAAIRAACGKRVDLAAVAYFFLVFHLCQGISQELAEYTRGASERPLWNLFEGGGAEVLLLFQLLGAALEAGAHLEAELGGRGRVALRRAGASAAFIRSPPFLVWVALGVGWDLLLVCEYFDEEGEPLAANPNRERARLCALLGVLKTIGEVIEAALMYP